MAGSSFGSPATLLLMLSTVLILVGSMSIAAWLYLLLANGGFWRTRGLLLSEPEREQLAVMETLRVAVVIPARNEEKTIGRAVKSLLAQQFPGELHIFVVDDGSNDRTAHNAFEAARSYNGEKRSVTVLTGRALEPGWSGKMWAVHQGVHAALTLAPDFLLLTDADIEHASTNMASLVSKAQGEPRYDLVSLMVRLHCRSVPERLLIPAFVFFFFMIYPPKWVSDGRRRSAGAAGGCILIRPEALERAGGIAAIGNEIIDDCALARNAKRVGSRLWLGLADRTESVRIYDSFAEIGRMIARTAFNQLGHSVLMLVGAIAGLALVFLLPVALLFAANLEIRALGVIALALMFASYLPIVRFYRNSPIWALSLPMAALFYLAATVASALQYWSGNGGNWKGRVQDKMQ